MRMPGLQHPDKLKKLDFKHPATWIATWFGCGLMRPGPGTWGTLGALPFGVALMLAGFPALIAGIALLFPLGLWAAGKVGEMTQEEDSQMIVIDEAAGIWIALLAATPDLFSILFAFAAFRFFDILKPWPVNWLDRKPGGAVSVMLDDVMAGLYAALVMTGLRYAGIDF